MFLKNLYYFFKFCCLVTITVEMECFDKVKLKNLKFTHSRISVAYAMFFIVLTVILNFFSVKYIYVTDISWMAMFDKLSQIIQTSFLVFSALIIMVYFCVKQSEIIKIAKNLSLNVSSVMNFSGKKSNDPAIENSVKKVYFSSLFIWVVTIVTSFRDGDPTEYRFGIMIASMFVYWVIIQYSLILILITCMFRMINSRFKNIFQKSIFVKDISLTLNQEFKNNSFK